jgi:hypothetical protein
MSGKWKRSFIEVKCKVGEYSPQSWVEGVPREGKQRQKLLGYERGRERLSHGSVFIKFLI